MKFQIGQRVYVKILSLHGKITEMNSAGLFGPEYGVILEGGSGSTWTLNESVLADVGPNRPTKEEKTEWSDIWEKAVT